MEEVKLFPIILTGFLGANLSAELLMLYTAQCCDTHMTYSPNLSDSMFPTHSYHGIFSNVF